MRNVGSFEAKTHLARILEEVEQGESFTITRHGKPVALLIPVPTPTRLPVASVIEDLRRFRRKHPLGDIQVRDLIDEGRRF